MTTLNNNHYLIILSGGWGTRLWPLSTKEKPKQFLHINSSNCLVKQTIIAFEKIFKRNNIYLTTTKNYNKLARACWKNIIIEPKKKNTALAIFFACNKIVKENKNAIITIIPSDHIYKKVQQNLSIIKECQQYCQKHPNLIYLLGQKPQKADKSFTYLINSGKKIKKIIEKPSLKYSKHLLKKSILSADTFTFSAKFLSDLIKNNNIDLNYNTAKAISFEKFLKTIKEKLQIFSDQFEFTDLGEWKNIFDFLPKNKDAIATNSKHFFNYKSGKSLVLTGNKQKIYGLVGINNLAIIDTPYALLVCNLDHDLSYNVKNLVKKIHDKQ